MQLQPVKRKKQLVRLSLEGGPGSGKTMFALLLAYGLTGNWNRIAVIDTESGSASLYCHLEGFNTLQLPAPYTSSRYIEAIETCEQAETEVIIIDSLSPEWVGQGGACDVYRAIKSSQCKKWDAVMPNHHALVDAILLSSAHVIVTVRTAGGKPLQQEGYAHDYTTILRLKNEVIHKVVKDRTGLFGPWCKGPIEPSHGKRLKKWSEAGEESVDEKNIFKIKACTSVEELNSLLTNLNDPNEDVLLRFAKKRKELLKCA